MKEYAERRCVPTRQIHEFNNGSICQCGAMRDDGEPARVVASEPVVVRVVPEPQSFGTCLHAAQLAAREHVSPHLRAAAELATKQGAHDDAAFCAWAAQVVDGELDPSLIRLAHAFIRFVEGGRG